MTELTTRAAVQGYQKKLARALDRRTGRTPAQETWLASARAAGLLARAAPSAARRQNRAALTAIRRLLSSADLDAARQGYALLEGLAEPALITDLSQGVSLIRGEIVRITPQAARRAHLRSRERRLWVALAVLRAAGRLDRSERLTLRGELLWDLGPLEGLTSLRALGFNGASEIDLSPLAAMPALRRLWIGDPGPRDLSSLPELTELKHLALYGGHQLSDLRPLAGLVGLQSLVLSYLWRLEDLSPLRGLRALESLSLNGCSGVRDLSPLSGLPALASLDLSGLNRLPQPLRRAHEGRATVVSTLRALTGSA